MKSVPENAEAATLVGHGFDEGHCRGGLREQHTKDVGNEYVPPGKEVSPC